MSKEVYRLYTVHGTQMFLDNQQTLRHYDPATAHYSLNPVYMRVSDGNRSLFTIRDNLFKYIVTIDGQGKVIESQSPVVLECIDNEDGSFSIAQNRRFWSAQRNTGAFVLAPKNLGWEHFTPDKAEFELTREYISPVIKNFVPEDEPQREPKLENPDVTVPAISVIIPMYNVEEFIEECLTSVLKQTFTDYEVLVVDDCSTDRSAAIVESMIEKFGGRLKLIRLEKNTGAAATPRNIGASLAIGKYLYFVDSDDILVENAFEILHSAAELHNADVVCNGINYRLDENGQSRLDLRFNLKQNSFYPKDVTQRIRSFVAIWGFTAPPWQRFVRRDFFIENRLEFPPAYVFDDTLVAFQYALCSRIYVVIADAIYFWRIRNTSSTRSRFAMVVALQKQMRLVESIFKSLNKFMTQYDLHPWCFYIMNAYFFRHFITNAGQHYMQRYYTSNPIGLIYNIEHELFSEGKEHSDQWLAYILTATNLQPNQLRDKEQLLEKLKLELKSLTERA